MGHGPWGRDWIFLGGQSAIRVRLHVASLSIPGGSSSTATSSNSEISRFASSPPALGLWESPTVSRELDARRRSGLEKTNQRWAGWQRSSLSGDDFSSAPFMCASSVSFFGFFLPLADGTARIRVRENLWRDEGFGETMLELTQARAVRV